MYPNPYLHPSLFNGHHPYPRYCGTRTENKEVPGTYTSPGTGNTRENTPGMVRYVVVAERNKSITILSVHQLYTACSLRYGMCCCCIELAVRRCCLDFEYVHGAQLYAAGIPAAPFVSTTLGAHCMSGGRTCACTLVCMNPAATPRYCHSRLLVTTFVTALFAARRNIFRDCLVARPIIVLWEVAFGRG